jgi:hypothetical protein
MGLAAVELTARFTEGLVLMVFCMGRTRIVGGKKQSQRPTPFAWALLVQATVGACNP